MKKKITTIGLVLLITGSIGIVLARNKAKIDAAANPEKEKLVVPVKAYEVQTDTFNTTFSITGTTVPVHEVKIASEVQGKLVGLYIKNGDMVRAGQIIAALDASAYNMQLTSIDASIAKAKLDLQRFTRLVELGGATQMQVESRELEIKSYEAQRKQVLDQIDHMKITAPFSGKIENVSVEPGSFVSFGTVLGQLIDNSSLKINVYLSEQEAFKVKQGLQVIVSSVVLDQPKTAKIDMISDKADASGKFLAEISFTNTEKEQLKAGILASVYFPADEVKTGLSIPVSALIAGSKDAKVYVINGDVAEHRSITTGIVTSGKVEVTGGLQAGEQVVISGVLNLENGVFVQINK